MNQSTSAALTVNAVAMLQTQRLAFSGRESVIKELAQNGRRAGAKSIHITYNPHRNWMAVIDNGSGISDMNTLLAVAESGWPDGIKQEETPYGLGFLSALFISDHICVCSRGKMICCSSESILGFEQIPIRNIKDTGKTVVILSGDKVKSLFNIDFDELFMGFPIPIRVGSRDVNREHALTTKRSFTVTEVGSIILNLEIEASETFDYRKNQRSRLRAPFSTVFYYQGFDVYHTGLHRHRKSHVVHLDTKVFKAVAPDRARLVDQTDVVSRVDLVLYNLCKAEIERLCRQDVGLLLDSYQTLKEHGLLGLYNEVDWLPAQVLALQSNSPRLQCNQTEDYLGFNAHHVSKESITTGKVTVFQAIEEEAGSFPLQMYCRQPNMFYLCDKLDDGHWIWPHLRTAEDISVEIINGREPSSEYYELGLECSVLMCERYVIRGPAGDYTPIGGMVYCLGDFEGDSEVLLIPDTDNNGDCLLQRQSCTDDCGDFRDSVADPLIEAFQVWLRRERSAGNPVELLKSLLGHALARKYPSLIGKRLLLDFKQGFTMEVEELP